MRSIYDPLYLELISRLRRARRSLRVTQGELASRLNKPQSYVSKIETAQRRLDLLEAAEWCAALGVAVNDVLPPEVLSTQREQRSDDGKRTNH